MNDEYLPGAGAADPSDEAHPDATARDAAGAGVAAAPVRAPVAPDTAGGMIRTAREAQGIDLASLAAMLKIPLRKLEALEEGRHADLPGHTFERALAQAACRVLKLDPKPVLALLPQLGANTLEHMSGGINTPFRDRAARGESGEPSIFLRPIMLLPLLLALAALALFLLPADWASRLPRFSLGGGSAASAPVLAASGGTSTTNVTLPAATLEASSPVPGAAPAATGTTPAAPASAAAPAGVDEVLAHPETPPSIPVQVTAAEDSWIEVIDAQGHVLLSRTVIAGESVGLDGPLPMKVKIGNARGTRLSLRGENVDLGPWTRDNVARLELK